MALRKTSAEERERKRNPARVLQARAGFTVSGYKVEALLQVQGDSRSR
jgi:hypothetical protein